MTQRKLYFFWFSFAVTALLLLLLQSLLFNRIELWGVHPYIPTCIAAVAATYTSRRGGAIFAFFLGFVCDLVIPGVFPCFYMLTLTACALVAGLISRRFLQHGLLCSAIVCAASLLIGDMAQLLFLAYRYRIDPGSAFFLLVREVIVTVLPALLVHFAFSKLSRFLDDV